MISRHLWRGFNKLHDIVGCFVCVEDKFLLLQRGSSKPQGGTWAPPAGKVEKGESFTNALVREISEETGLIFEPENIHKVQEYYENIGTYDFIFHVYETRLDSAPSVRIDTLAHTTYQWVTPDQALAFPLIQDFDVVIKDFFNK